MNAIKACLGRAPTSFTPDTPVLLADSSHKPIGTIAVGDRVVASDPEANRTESEPVTHVIVGEGSSIWSS